MNTNLTSFSFTRFVYIQLQPETDAEKLKQELAKEPFGTGFLKLEKRNVLPSEHLKPEDIDPYTIFMGNIHPSTSIQSVKQSVPKAYRVDVGFAKKHKFGRYAFAKFRTATEARQAFTTLRQASSNGPMDLVVRFRRLRGNITTHGLNNNNRHDLVKSGSVKPVTDKESTAVAISDNDDKNEKVNNEIENGWTDTKRRNTELHGIKINPASTSIEYIASNLLTNDILEWELPMFNIGTNNSSLMSTSASSDGSCMGGDLDDLFNQLYSDVSSVFTDDSDLCSK